VLFQLFDEKLGLTDGILVHKNQADNRNIGKIWLFMLV